MPTISRRSRRAKASSSQPLDPYRALMLAALLQALKHSPHQGTYWVFLNDEGKSYLKRLAGIEGADLRRAIVDGVNAGSIETCIKGGSMPAITLTELVNKYVESASKNQLQKSKSGSK